MGDGTGHGPANWGAVKTGGGKALDSDPLITVMGVAAVAVAMNGNPAAIQRIVWPLLLHPLAGHGMHSEGLVDLLKLRKAAGRDLPTGHPGDNEKGEAQAAILQEQQTPPTPQQNDVPILLTSQFG